MLVDQPAGVKRTPGACPRACERGVTLIEVLIAIVVMAIGLAGIAGLQATAIQHNHQAYQYSMAATMAENLAESMRANVGGVLDGAYALDLGKTPANPGKNCASVECTSAELAAWDLARWYNAMAEVKKGTFTNIPGGESAVLPSAQASVACVDSPCTEDSPHLITIFWDAERTGATGTGCDPTKETDLACFRLAVLP